MEVPTEFPPASARAPARRLCTGGRRSWALAALGLLATALAPSALAEARYGALLFQNDLFLGRDGGGYTNGIYLSSVRVASADEERIAPGLLVGPLASVLGLSHATLAATSFGQGIVTPKDIARRVPDPADAPYAGFLVLRSAQVARQGDTADVAAFSLGLIGPASGAEQVQRAIHRLTGSTAPQGWDTQVSSRPLVGLERARAWRFARAPGSSGTAGADAILQAGGALGNLESSLGASLLLRYGTGLSRSFPAAVVNGYSTDPFVVGAGWFVFAGVSADRVLYHAGLRDEAGLRRERTAATLGLAYGWERSSVTFAVRTTDPLVSSSGRQMFGSLTWLIRID
jgi:lipid A 3-O-deacylase